VAGALIRVSTVLAALLAIAPSALGQDYLESNRAWHAYRAAGPDGPVCYMLSSPTEQRGTYTGRGDAYLSVARRPGFAHLVGVAFGFPVDEGQPILARVDDDESFALTLADGHAYPSDAEAEAALVAAMRAGAELTLEAVSTGGTAVTDSYSLFGFTATLEALAAACP
jgi:hypothetical protein